MRLLFAHDHRFYRGPAGELYTPGSFPAYVWDRYLQHFEDVHVIARDGGPLPEGGRLSRADRDQVTFEYFPSLSSLGQLTFRPADLDARMAAAVASADAVVARLPSEIGLLAVRHAKMLSKPYAVEVVACVWDSLVSNGALSARVYAPLAFVRNRRAIAGAPQALYVTSSWLQGRYPTRGHAESASNVYLLPMDSAAIKRREDRLSQLLKGRPPVLGTVASLHTMSKGIQTALGALARLRSSGLDFSYKVLGPGPAERWQALAERLGVADLVRFDGTRSAGDGVSGWLDEIDIHLQPSFQEGLPRATIEAMSRGVACIGSTCGGIPELLPPERLHRPGDIDGLSTRIRNLATDPAAIVAASRADRETAMQFDPQELAARRSKFFGRLRAEAEKQRSS